MCTIQWPMNAWFIMWSLVSGADSCSIKSGSNVSSTLSSLPPLPGLSSGVSSNGMMPGLQLPGMMLPNMMSTMRPAPLGEISPSPRTTRRSVSSRSPSPPYSPRSERRYSPDRHSYRGQSPARSERGYRDSYRDSRDGYNRDYYRDDRRYRHSRDGSPRSDRGSRYSDGGEDYRYGRSKRDSYTSSPPSSNYRVWTLLD